VAAAAAAAPHPKDTLGDARGSRGAAARAADAAVGDAAEDATACAAIGSWGFLLEHVKFAYANGTAAI